MKPAKTKTTGGATTSELCQLQKVVAKALILELEAGMDSKQFNQAAIRNALQMLRDSNIVATDDMMNDYERLSTLLPELDVDAVKVASRYS